MKESLKVKIKTILASICVLGNLILLRENIDWVWLEVRYWNEYSLSYFFRYLFYVIIIIGSIGFLVRYILDNLKKAELHRDLEADNSFHATLHESEIPQPQSQEEIEPEELKEMLSKDFQEEKQGTSH